MKMRSDDDDTSSDGGGKGTSMRHYEHQQSNDHKVIP